MSAAVPLLRVENLAAQYASRYGAQPGRVHGIRFTVERGATFGIVGEAGAGKSLVALALSGTCGDGMLVSGRVLLDGWPSPERALYQQRIKAVFQDPRRTFAPDATLGQQLSGAAHAGARQRVGQVLDALCTPRTPNWLDCYPYQLPRDVCRRAALALALLAQPDVLIADEPAAALDAPLFDLLREHQTRRGMSLILLTRNAQLAAKMCDDVAVLCAGRIVERARAAALFGQPTHPYTAAWLDGRRQPGSAAGLDASQEALPGPTSATAGCMFVERCALRMPVCSVERPLLLRSPHTQRLRACHAAPDVVCRRHAALRGLP